MKLFHLLHSSSSIGISNIQSYIFKIIQHTGPMTVHNFMREMLTNEQHGYYINKNVFGRKGDFITSPEISQIFGELVGVWIVNEWINQKKHKPFQIVELGPGKATMMNDILTAIVKFPDLFNELSIKLVEISPKLRTCQENLLKQCFQQLGRDVPVEWFDNFNAVPTGIPTCYLAHEFFDALPIHKFKRNSAGKWREVLVDRDRDQLKFILANKETVATLAFGNILEKYPSMTDLELSPMSLSILNDVCQRISESGGFGLIADYGHCGDKGDTFRAFKDHRLSDPLTNLGESDLTADVNFQLFTDYLGDEYRGQLTIHGPVCQSSFLRNMGIDYRLRMLLNNCRSSAQAEYLIGSYRMMMDSAEMGDRFRFLSVLPSKCYPDQYLPAGFCELE